MAGVSQALIEFANQHRQEAAPGIEVLVTPRYRITLQPDFPIPGPNSVSWIRCGPDEAGDVIDQARAVFAARRLPTMWILDPGTRPADFPSRLSARGIEPDPRSPSVDVMVLPAGAPLAAPAVPGLEIVDALRDLETFTLADAVNAEAFGSSPRAGPQHLAALERRRLAQLAAGNRRVLLATVAGEPAGSAGLTLHPPGGAIINGGAVRPRFRGRGVYRALVAARARIAGQAGVEGLAVWGAPSSAPTLARLGFVTVGWRRFHVDTGTAEGG
jgi:GNAT superfamily N-acetyltransferase